MKINIENKDKRLDIYSASVFNLTRAYAQKMIEKGDIKVNGQLSRTSYKLKVGDEVSFIQKKEDEFQVTPKNIPLDILYEDDDLIVLNKQKGLICHPTAHNEEDTLVSALIFHTGGKLSSIGAPLRCGIVHRLDKDTSGLMLAAKNNEAHIKLAEDIKTKKTIRKYRAICHGIIEKDCGIIDKPLVHYLGKTVKMHTSSEGQTALSEYKVIERYNNATYLELKLQTGRTHQIRCHMAYINHPLIGDELYGSKGFKQIKGLKTKGQVLQSYYLSFTHPKTNEIMEFEIEPDSDIKNTLKVLRSMK